MASHGECSNYNLVAESFNDPQNVVALLGDLVPTWTDCICAGEALVSGNLPIFFSHSEVLLRETLQTLTLTVEAASPELSL